MTERSTSFMTCFIAGSLALLTGAILSFVLGLQKQRKGLVTLSVCLFLLLIGAWQLGIFLTKCKATQHRTAQRAPCWLSAVLP